MYSLVEWQEDGLPLGIISLKAIETPRIAFTDYKIEQIVRASCTGFAGLHDAKLLHISENRKELQIMQKELLKKPPTQKPVLEKEGKEETKKQDESRTVIPVSEKEGKEETKKQKQDENRKRKFLERKNEAELRKKAKSAAYTNILQHLEEEFERLQPERSEVQQNVAEEVNADTNEDHTIKRNTENEDDVDVDVGLSNDEEDYTLMDLVPLNAKGYPTIAQKVPRKQHSESLTSEEKYASLEEKFREQCRENDVLKCNLTLPKPGILSPNLAQKYKIDPQTLLLMTDEQLKNFIPTYGDIHAARKYSQKIMNDEQKNERRSNLLSKLRKKMKLKNTKSSENDSDSDLDNGSSIRKRKLLGNHNAVKDNRKIELGWFHWDNDEFRQVKARNGGGTRNVTAPKSWLPEDIINHGKNIFFLNGKSKKGKIEEMEFELRNFLGDTVSNNCTVRDMYAATDAKLLRFYIYTKTIQSKTDLDMSDVDLPDPKLNVFNTDVQTRSLESESSLVVLNNPANGVNIQSEKGESADKGKEGDSEIPSTSIQTTHFPNQQMFIFENEGHEEVQFLYRGNDNSDLKLLATLNADTNIIELGSNVSLSNLLADDENETLPITDSSNVSSSSAINELSISPPVFYMNENENYTIRIHQGNIFYEMLELFQSDNIDMDNCTIVRVSPSGTEEAGEGTGILRDIITEFWDIFYTKCCDGNGLKVPILRHDMQEREWKSVARILCSGFKSVGYFPVQLAKVLMEDAMYGYIKSDLVQTFLQFIPNTERVIVKEALENFGKVDKDELLDVLECHECRKSPSEENFKSIIQEIAHKELLQQPKFVIDCWKSEFKNHLHIDSNALNKLYEEKQPTVSKILKALKFPDSLSLKEQTSASYFKRFIKSLDDKELKCLLRFCTGSNLMCEVINVEFSKLVGFERRPTAHTCGYILRLPSTYDSMAEMKEEFLNIFKANVWDMDYI